MNDERIIAADATREDDAIEASIRPKRLDEYLGQQPVREQMKINTWSSASPRPRAASM